MVEDFDRVSPTAMWRRQSSVSSAGEPLESTLRSGIQYSACWFLPLSIWLQLTAQLPCFHAGSVVELCCPSVIRFMAPKATGPVWGFHPLHHVTGDVGELSSAILRYSS